VAKTEPVARRASEARRVEGLWSGEFGDAYVERNLTVGDQRGPFWQDLLARLRVEGVLEVGCNVGANLQWIVRGVPPRDVYGVDINEKALREVRKRLPDVNTLWSPARSLPFRDERFDLVFTSGVLIHQPPRVLPLVMAEVVRCARRYVVANEYFGTELAEIPYRGQTGALWKGDYGALYEELFPELRLVKSGPLPEIPGDWEGVHHWLFEKRRA
jgi:pseudaminic acid biosynthesis-associated methylase